MTTRQRLIASLENLRRTGKATLEKCDRIQKELEEMEGDDSPEAEYLRHRLTGSAIAEAEAFHLLSVRLAEIQNAIALAWEIERVEGIKNRRKPS